jgi:hypothetical protein
VIDIISLSLDLIFHQFVDKWNQEMHRIQSVQYQVPGRNLYIIVKAVFLKADHSGIAKLNSQAGGSALLRSPFNPSAHVGMSNLIMSQGRNEFQYSAHVDRHNRHNANLERRLHQYGSRFGVAVWNDAETERQRHQEFLVTGSTKNVPLFARRFIRDLSHLLEVPAIDHCGACACNIYLAST